MLARGEREINQLLLEFVCCRFAFGFSGPPLFLNQLFFFYDGGIVHDLQQPDSGLSRLTAARFPCNLQHIGAGNCHFNYTTLLYSQHFGIRTVHFPLYLQHCGAQTFILHGILRQGFIYGWFTVVARFI